MATPELPELGPGPRMAVLPLAVLEQKLNDWLPRAIIYRRQMLQLVAQAASLPGCVFQRDAHWGTPRGAEHFVQSRHDLLERLLFAMPQMRSRVHDQKWQSEVRRKLNLLDERLKRLIAVGAGRRSKVDEVTRMAKDRR